MEAATTKRIDVGRVMSETFSLYGANAGPLLGSAFIIFLISGASCRASSTTAAA